MQRSVLTLLILTAMLACFGQGKTNGDSLQANASTDLVVTLLGTGMPQPVMDRFGPSILVQAGSETLLFDAGRGCLQRLRQLHISYSQIDALFLTHLHSDHIVGLPDLWLTGWLVSDRNDPLSVYGPQGTKQMIEHLRKAYAFDIRIRIADDKKGKPGSQLLSRKMEQGVVYQNNGVRVTAIKVDHHNKIPAFGFRIDYHNHSVVLSGDTRYSENLIAYARGTDLLVHEVVIAPDTVSKSDPKYPVFAHHTTIEQAAHIFSQVQPQLAVYAHIVKPFGKNEQELLSRTQKSYQGPVMIGADLMSFTIGDSVSVAAWKGN